MWAEAETGEFLEHNFFKDQIIFKRQQKYDVNDSANEDSEGSEEHGGEHIYHLKTSGMD